MKLQTLCNILPKNQEFLHPGFFLQSDENGAVSQFRSFEEKVYFITWIINIRKSKGILVTQIICSRIAPNFTEMTPG